jgi:hypothetical protein
MNSNSVSSIPNSGLAGGTGKTAVETLGKAYVELPDVLKELYLATIDYMASGPDMPGHDEIERTLEEAMRDAEQVLNQCDRPVPSIDD